MCFHTVRHPQRIVLYFPVPAPPPSLPNNHAHNFNKPVSKKCAESHHRVWRLQTLTCCFRAIFELHFLTRSLSPTDYLTARRLISQAKEKRLSQSASGDRCCGRRNIFGFQKQAKIYLPCTLTFLNQHLVKSRVEGGSKAYFQ